MAATTHGPAPDQGFPPPILIPSADYGGPIRSVFDQSGDSYHHAHAENGGVFLDSSGNPEDVISAISAVHWVADGLSGVFGRDGHALVFPGERFASPVSPARRLDYLDTAIADLTRLRAWFAAQPAIPETTD